MLHVSWLAKGGVLQQNCWDNVAKFSSNWAICNNIKCCIYDLFPSHLRIECLLKVPMKWNFSLSFYCLTWKKTIWYREAMQFTASRYLFLFQSYKGLNIPSKNLWRHMIRKPVWWKFQWSTSHLIQVRFDCNFAWGWSNINIIWSWQSFRCQDNHIILY